MEDKLESVISEAVELTEVYNRSDSIKRQKAIIAAYLVKYDKKMKPNTFSGIASRLLEIINGDSKDKESNIDPILLERYLASKKNVSKKRINFDDVDEALKIFLAEKCQQKTKLDNLWSRSHYDASRFSKDLSKVLKFKARKTPSGLINNRIDVQLKDLLFAGASEKANEYEQRVHGYLFSNVEHENTKILGLVGSRCTGKSNLIGTYIRNRRTPKRGGEHRFKGGESKPELPVFFRSCHNKSFPEIVENVAEFYLEGTPPESVEACLQIIEEKCKIIPALLIFAQLESHDNSHAIVRMRQGGLRRLFEVLDGGHQDLRVIYTAKDHISGYLGKAGLKSKFLGMPTQVLGDIKYFISDGLFEHFEKTFNIKKMGDLCLETPISGDILTILAALMTIEGGSASVITFLNDTRSQDFDIGLSINNSGVDNTAIAKMLWKKFSDTTDIAGMPANAFFQIFRYLAISQDGIEFGTLGTLLKKYPIQSQEMKNLDPNKLISLLRKFAEQSKGMISVLATRSPVEFNSENYMKSEAGTVLQQRYTFFLDRNVARSYLEFASQTPEISTLLRHDFLKFAALAREKSHFLRLTKRTQFGLSKYDFRYDIQNFFFLVQSLDPKELIKERKLSNVSESELYKVQPTDYSRERFDFIFRQIVFGELDRRGNLGRLLDQNNLKLDIYLRLFDFPPSPHPDWNSLKFEDIPPHWNNILSSSDIGKVLLSLVRGAYFAGRYDICIRLMKEPTDISRWTSSFTDTGFFESYLRAKIYAIDAEVRSSQNVKSSLNKALQSLVSLRNNIDDIDEYVECETSWKSNLKTRLDCKYHWIRRLSETVGVKLNDGGLSEDVQKLCTLTQIDPRLIGLRNRRILIASILHKLEVGQLTKAGPDMTSEFQKHITDMENLNSQNISLIDEIGGAERATVLMDSARILSKKAYITMSPWINPNQDAFTCSESRTRCFDLWDRALTYVHLTTNKIHLPGTPIVYETALASYSYKLYLDLVEFYYLINKFDKKFSRTGAFTEANKAFRKGLENLVLPDIYEKHLRAFGQQLLNSINFSNGENNLYVKRFTLLMDTGIRQRKFGRYNPANISGDMLESYRKLL